MQRRALLATLAGLSVAAGCSSSQSEPTPTDLTPAAVPTTQTSTVPTRDATCTDATTTHTTSEPTPAGPREPDVTVPDVPPGERAAGYRITELDADAAWNGAEDSARYHLQPTTLSQSERQGTVVRAIDDIEPSGVRIRIREAFDDGSIFLSEVSCELRAAVEHVDVFTDEGREVGGLRLSELDRGGGATVEFDVELVDDTATPDDPAAFDLSVTNVGESDRTIFSGSVPPFETVYADRTDGERLLLWYPYEDEGCYHFTEERVDRCSIGMVTGLPAGESVTRRYELRVDSDQSFGGRSEPPGTGAYRVDGGLSVQRDDDQTDLSVDYAFAFALEPAKN